MKENIFDMQSKSTENEDYSVITHDEEMAIIADASRYGSMKESAIQHGITNISYLFPDNKLVDNGAPKFLDNNNEWVAKVMGSVSHTPFARIKTRFADITADTARAKGFTKGNTKTDETFAILKRTTEPTTIYKHQSLDRDDVVDITDFDTISWLKTEMRAKLNEEIARAILISDGRTSVSDDKIDETHVRPVWTDNEVYSVHFTISSTDVSTEADTAKAFIKSVIKARKKYKGSGKPTLYTTEDMLTEMLLLEDSMGRPLYEDEAKLATKLRVKEIVTVTPMEGQQRTVEEADHTNTTRDLLGIVVNLVDYNIGADKGGAVNMFDDFDIDLNKMKYLIETRISGALTMPQSALVFELSTPVTQEGGNT